MTVIEEFRVHLFLSKSVSWFFFSTDKLTSASKHSVSTHGSPNLSPNTSAQTSRRGSISSLSSVSSVLEEKDDDKIRCCHHCKDTLRKREIQMDEKDHTPEIVIVYQVNLGHGSFMVHWNTGQWHTHTWGYRFIDTLRIAGTGQWQWHTDTCCTGHTLTLWGQNN